MKKGLVLGLVLFMMAILAYPASAAGIQKPTKQPAGGGLVAPLTMILEPSTVHVRQQMNLVVDIAPPQLGSGIPQNMPFTVSIWDGGQGWGGENYPPEVTVGAITWVSCDQNGCTYTWTGKIAPGEVAMFSMATFAGYDYGQFRFATADWSGLHDEVSDNVIP